MCACFGRPIAFGQATITIPGTNIIPLAGNALGNLTAQNATNTTAGQIIQSQQQHQQQQQQQSQQNQTANQAAANANAQNQQSVNLATTKTATIFCMSKC